MMPTNVWFLMDAIIGSVATVADRAPEVPAAAMPDDIALAFEAIYRYNADAVYRFCLSQLRDAALAEDVAAEVFASAWAAYPGSNLDGPVAARAWVFRIARNATIDQYRRGASRRSMLARLRVRDGGTATVESTAAVRADLNAVLAALAHLSKRERTLVGLRVAAGLEFAELAAVMRMNESAAKMATHRALAKVRARVGCVDGAAAEA